MDIGARTAADGLALTANFLETQWAKVTDHQITALDIAQGFNWGVDLPMGGFGILAARHVNGTIMDARHFLDGDDAEAIQAAVGFAAATSSASGVVWVPTKATAWAIDATITVPSNVTIIGDPHRTPISLDANVAAFTIASGATDVMIRDFEMDGNARTADFVSLAGNADRVSVINCQIGSESAASSNYIDGYIVNGSTGNCDRLKIKDCTMYGGGGFVSIDGGVHIEIENNRFEDPAGGNTAVVNVIDLNGCDYAFIEDNYIYGHDATDPIDRAALLNNCDWLRVVNNKSIGGRLSAWKFIECDFGEMHGNDWLNGATGSVANDQFICWLDGCEENRVKDNTITGVDSLAGTVPIGCLYALAETDGAVVTGSANCANNIIEDNLFSIITNWGTMAGPFRVETGNTIKLTSNFTTTATFRRGNLYCKPQTSLNGLGSISGGAVTEAVTYLGLPPSDASGGPLMLQATARGTATQSLYVDNQTTADQITVGNGDGTNLAAGSMYLHMDG